MKILNLTIVLRSLRNYFKCNAGRLLFEQTIFTDSQHKRSLMSNQNYNAKIKNFKTVLVPHQREDLISKAMRAETHQTRRASGGVLVPMNRTFSKRRDTRHDITDAESASSCRRQCRKLKTFMKTANATPSAFVYRFTVTSRLFKMQEIFFCLSFISKFKKSSFSYGSKGRDTVTCTIYSHKSIYGQWTLPYATRTSVWIRS